jgi:S1-C subfamily serine protease
MRRWSPWHNFDLPVLKIDKTGLTPVTMGDSDHVKVGETVVAIGNPLGLKQTVSVGVVSAVHRNMGFSDFDDLIQTDAAINPGNSSGPLFNSVGEVIGINQAIYTIGNGKGSIGLGFAISINEARYMIDRLRTTSTTDQGYLGFSSKVDARPRYRFILHQHRGSARNGSLARQRSIERWSKRR